MNRIASLPAYHGVEAAGKREGEMAMRNLWNDLRTGANNADTDSTDSDGAAELDYAADDDDADDDAPETAESEATR